MSTTETTGRIASAKIMPMLAIHGVADAIEFYKKAFGATELFRLTDGDKVVHAEVKIGESIVMLAEEHPAHNASPKSLGGSTVILAIQVPDADAAFGKAVAAGAQVVFTLRDQFYGERSGRVVDPFGHLWLISSHIEDVSPAEMQKRLTAMTGSSAN